MRIVWACLEQDSVVTFELLRVQTSEDVFNINTGSGKRIKFRNSYVVHTSKLSVLSMVAMICHS